MHKPVLKIAHLLRVFDTEAVDGTVNGIGRGTVSWSKIMQTMQSGQVQHYAIIMAVGILVFIGMIFIVF